MKQQKHNAVDELLKGLADYKPNAKPDWDSFFNDYHDQVSKVTDSGNESINYKRLYTIIKSGAIAIIALSGITAGYFIFFDNNNPTHVPGNNPTIELQTAPVENTPFSINPDTPEINALPDADDVTNSSGLPQENISTVPISETDQDKSILNKNPKTNQSISEPTLENDIEPAKTEKEISPQLNDSAAGQPVIIKKTILITDTVKIARPRKK